MAKENKEAVVISFANQKGGVGKSTLTAMLANYIHNETELQVFVSDSDNQKTLVELRSEDLSELEGNEQGEEKVDPDDMYYILPVHAKDFMNTYEESIKDEFDVCLLDVPGTMDAPGVIEALVAVDYLFIPMGTDRKESNSSMEFYNWYMDNVKPLREEAGFEVNVFGVMNRVRKNITEYKHFSEIKDQLPLKFVSVDLPDNQVTFQRNSNTWKSLEYSTGGTVIQDFCKEILSLCKIN